VLLIVVILRASRTHLGSGRRAVRVFQRLPEQDQTLKQNLGIFSVR
jgi:hypothetical protein